MSGMCCRILLYTCIILALPAYAQESRKQVQKGVTQDTLSVKDSLKIYKNIQSFASKRKFTSWLYNLVFIDPTPTVEKPPLSTSVSKKKLKDNYDKYKNRTIRSVRIITLDPFGTSVIDTVELTDENFFKRAGNKLHIKSSKKIIQKQLLFETYDKLDPLKIRESERLLRQSAYIRDAKISLNPVPKTKDSVDVYVVVQDLWSVKARYDVYPIAADFTLEERNFLGVGHRFNNKLTYNAKQPMDYALRGHYSVPYIASTYISLTGLYFKSTTSNYYGLVLNRPFYSPLTKWAGGISAIRYNSIQEYPVPDLAPLPLRVSQLNKDAWIGRSFKLSNAKTDAARSARFIGSGRVIHNGFIERPGVEIDTAHVNRTYQFYLTSFGISSQQFYKEQFLYKFDVAEDVPEGRVFAVTTGYELKEFASPRTYIGAKVSLGNHHDNFGYLSYTLEYGTFLRRSIAEDGAIMFSSLYFSDRWQYKKWHSRQFVDFKLTYGVNRRANNEILLNGQNGINGFGNTSISGNSKAVVNFQSVFYTPYRFIGFRFAGFLFSGLGLISPQYTTLFKSKIYQAYGLGLIIRNEHLVFNTIKISFGLYPNIPDPHPNFRFNSIDITDFRMRNFFYEQPEVISYR